MSEEWRVLPRDENYEISSLGRIRRIGRGMGATPGRILKPSIQDGYLVVTIPPQNRRSAYVHVLVAEAFHGPRPEGHDALHRNGDRGDPAESNVYWGTPLQNAADREAHGHTARGEACGASKITADIARQVRDHAKAHTITATAMRFGVSRSQVHRIKHNQSWRHI